jgi:Mg-chelatase subunit ChlD
MADIVKKRPGFGLVKRGKSALSSLKASALAQSTHEESLMLVLDHSGSMMSIEDSSGFNRLDKVKEAVRIFLERSDPSKSHVGLCKFGTMSEIVCPITNQYQLVRLALQGTQVAGCTSILPALDMSNYALLDSDVHVRRMIVLSDGEAQDSQQAVAWAGGILARNRHRLAIIDTVYFSSTEEGKELMITLAELSGGKFYYAPDFARLVSAFRQLDAKTRGLLTDGR